MDRVLALILGEFFLERKLLVFNLFVRLFHFKCPRPLFIRATLGAPRRLSLGRGPGITRLTVPAAAAASAAPSPAHSFAVFVGRGCCLARWGLLRIVGRQFGIEVQVPIRLSQRLFFALLATFQLDAFGWTFIATAASASAASATAALILALLGFAGSSRRRLLEFLAQRLVPWRRRFLHLKVGIQIDVEGHVVHHFTPT